MNVKDVYNPNKLFHLKDKLVAISKQEIVSPANLQVDLTNRCNNKCSWCFYDVYDLPEFSRDQSLSKDIALNVPLEFKSIGGQSIEWTGGGEPLVYTHFVDVVQKARVIGIHQALVTNGRNLTRERLDSVIDFDWVRVSLNSASPKMYEIQHGNDSFYRVIRHIENFANKKSDKCILGVSMIVDDRNFHEISNMVSYAKRTGANNARISIPQTPKDGKLFEGIWHLVEEQLKYAKEYEDENFTVFTNADRLDTLNHKTRSKRCYYHHITPSLGANGVVYPCCHFKYLPQYNLGNINEMSLAEIWNGEKRRQFIETIGENCETSCWMNGKNTLSDYIIKDPEDVPHLAYP